MEEDGKRVQGGGEEEKGERGLEWKRLAVGLYI